MSNQHENPSTPLEELETSPDEQLLEPRQSARSPAEGGASYPDAPVSYRYSENERVQLASGELQYRETDFVLPGRNGFDLAVTRVYSSARARPFLPALESCGSDSLRENAHDRIQYGIGLGWSFELPSIELSSEDGARLLHLTDGRSFEILETGGELSLRDYGFEDVTAAAGSGALVHPSRADTAASYDVTVAYKNGQTDYFKEILENGQLSRYTLTARKDRFGSITGRTADICSPSRCLAGATRRTARG